MDIDVPDSPPSDRRAKLPILWDNAVAEHDELTANSRQGVVLGLSRDAGKGRRAVRGLLAVTVKADARDARRAAPLCPRSVLADFKGGALVKRAAVPLRHVPLDGYDDVKGPT